MSQSQIFIEECAHALGKRKMTVWSTWFQIMGKISVKTTYIALDSLKGLLYVIYAVYLLIYLTSFQITQNNRISRKLQLPFFSFSDRHVFVFP